MKNYSRKTNQKVTRYRTPSSFRVMKPMAQRPFKADQIGRMESFQNRGQNDK